MASFERERFKYVQAFTFCGDPSFEFRDVAEYFIS